MMNANKAVTLIGIGDDGCIGLSSRAVNAVAGCQVLAGGERQMEFFPQFSGERIVFKSGLIKIIDQLVELSEENNVCILASGDPMFYGIGALLIKKVGIEHVEVIPQPSSMQLAFARAGLKWDDAELFSLHGRTREGFLTRIKRFAKIGCFTDDQNSPANMARYMLEHGEKQWRSWVCENLSGPDERIRQFDNLEELAACDDIGPLNVWILERSLQGWVSPPAIPNLHEDQFSKRMPRKGLITKKEVRYLSLGEMRLRKDSIIWDIGAASGSIAIESALTAYEGRAYAIEVDPESIQCCRENLKTFGVDNVRIVEGRAPVVLETIEEDPDAIFVGGSKGSLKEIIDVALHRLKPNGRLVVNAITFENIQEAYQTFKEKGLQVNVIQLNISRGVPLAHYLRYEAQNPIHIFSVSKPEVEETEL